MEKPSAQWRSGQAGNLFPCAHSSWVASCGKLQVWDHWEHILLGVFLPVPPAPGPRRKRTSRHFILPCDLILPGFPAAVRCFRRLGRFLTSKDFPFPSIDATMGLIFVGAALREPLSRWRREKINTIKPHKEVPICLSGNGKKEAFFMQGLLIFHPKIFFKLSVGKLAATIKRKDCDI